MKKDREKLPSREERKRIFIKRATERHNGKYDYSLMGDWVTANTKIKIICPVHGEFMQTPKLHLKCECNKCGYLNAGVSLKKFIERSKALHNDKYDYSKVSYKSVNDDVIIICPTHGEFTQRASGHLYGYGCAKCGVDNIRYDTKKFIELANRKHKNKFSYDKVVYKGSKERVTITCPRHGDFQQVPNDHLRGRGCLLCKMSRGEWILDGMLGRNHIEHIREYSVDDSRYKYDFYLPDLNVLLEYDGEQHFKEISHYGGKEELMKVRKRDQIKNEIAAKHNIPLIRFKYDVIEHLSDEFSIEISKLYPYRHNKKFYKNKEDLPADATADECDTLTQLRKRLFKSFPVTTCKKRPV